jgi:hypothetical protein
LKWLKPCSRDESVKRLTFSSEYPAARSDYYFDCGEYTTLTEPSDGSGVSGVSDLLDLGLSLLLGRLLCFQQGKSLVFGDGVGDISERGGLDEPGIRGQLSVLRRVDQQGAHSSGVKSAMSFQSGFPRALANMSQTALQTAAVARAMTPFSGPNHRCCGSATTTRNKLRSQSSVNQKLTEVPERSHVAEELFNVFADYSLSDLLNGVADLIDFQLYDRMSAQPAYNVVSSTDSYRNVSTTP